MSQPIQAKSLQGFKYFRMVSALLESLHDEGTERDRGNNRKLFFDQYGLLMLLYFFNPIVTSLRGLQQTTHLKKVQRLCGVKPTALGSLSEAARVFDPTLLEPVIAELSRRSLQRSTSLPSAEEAALKDLVAVDGSLLPAIPSMAWALWQNENNRAAKMHVAFAVFPATPVQVRVTHGNASEREQWRRMVQPGGFYVADRGYSDYSLFKELDEQGAYFLVRVQNNTAYQVAREQTIDGQSGEVGVIRDVILKRLGTEKHHALLKSPLRLVEIQHATEDKSWILVTNKLDLPAHLIFLAYRYRWQVELYFRWLKCVLGCRHLLSQSESGVTLQVYFGIIASLLISLWVGGKPTKRTFEMICLHLSGWADEQETRAYLNKVRLQNKPP